MQRLGELNNKLIVEQIYEPESKNVIWKDPVNNMFKEYVNGAWVKSENIDTAKEEFPYEWIKLSDIKYTKKDSDNNTVLLEICKVKSSDSSDFVCSIINKCNDAEYACIKIQGTAIGPSSISGALGIEKSTKIKLSTDYAPQASKYILKVIVETPNGSEPADTGYVFNITDLYIHVNKDVEWIVQ